MIFKIVDGREYFYQWDTNRQIAVDDPTITEVHFCNRVDNCSLVVEVVDGVANVPNVILQYGFKLKVFGYDGEATMHEQEFEVKARTKPSDYVYTETEIKRFDDLNKRIDEIEAEGISPEAIDAAVGKYLEENPIQDITKVSQLENDADYATGGYVDSKVAGIVMPDLEPYAKKTDIPDTTGLASKSFVVSYVGEAVKDVEVDLTDYAKKSDIPKDYLTEIPAQYVTESELQAKGYSTFSGRYADLTGKPDIPSTDGLAPVTYVDNKFNSINLTDYAKKAEVATTYAKKSDIPTDYLKEVPAEYVTENELAAKNYANKTYVEEFVTDFIAETKTIALVNKNTTGEEIQAILDSGSLPVYIMGEDFLNIYIPFSAFTSTEYIFTRVATDAGLSYSIRFDKTTNTWGEETRNYLATRSYVTNNSVTMTQVEAKGYATETYVDNAIANIDTSEVPTEVYNIVVGATKEQVTDAKTIEYLDKLYAGEAVFALYDQHPIVHTNKDETTSSILVSYLYRIHGLTLEYSGSLAFEKNEDGWLLKSKQSGMRTDITKTSQLTNDSDFTTMAAVEAKEYATEQYVDDAIANIDIPGGGGGSGSDGEHPVFFVDLYRQDTWNYHEITPEMQAFMDAYQDNNGHVALYINVNSDTELLWSPATVFRSPYNGQYFIYSTPDFYRANGLQEYFMCYIYPGDQNWYGSWQTAESGGGGGSDWTYTTDVSDFNLYNAKEIYICVKDDMGIFSFSHRILGTEDYDTLGNHTNENCAFTIPDGSDSRNRYWFYDGSCLQISFENGYDTSSGFIIAYK